MQTEKKVSSSLLLKYSKYVYRILYCLAKYSRSSLILQQVDNIQKHIIPKRGKSNINDIDFKLLLYKEGMSLKKYINYLTEYILSSI
jgi:hypothetical protein